MTCVQPSSRLPKRSYPPGTSVSSSSWETMTPGSARRSVIRSRRRASTPPVGSAAGQVVDALDHGAVRGHQPDRSRAGMTMVSPGRGLASSTPCQPAGKTSDSSV